MGISRRDGESEVSVFRYPKFWGLWEMGKKRSKNKGEGQKVSSERPYANQIPSTCVLGCIFSFLLLVIRWKLYSPHQVETVFSRKQKSPKTSRAPSSAGMAGTSWAEVEGILNMLIFSNEVRRSFPLRKFIEAWRVQLWIMRPFGKFNSLGICETKESKVSRLFFFFFN